MNPQEIHSARFEHVTEGEIELFRGLANKYPNQLVFQQRNMRPSGRIVYRGFSTHAGIINEVTMRLEEMRRLRTLVSQTAGIPVASPEQGPNQET